MFLLIRERNSLSGFFSQFSEKISARGILPANEKLRTTFSRKTFRQFINAIGTKRIQPDERKKNSLQQQKNLHREVVDPFAIVEANAGSTKICRSFPPARSRKGRSSVVSTSADVNPCAERNARNRPATSAHPLIRSYPRASSTRRRRRAGP